MAAHASVAEGTSCKHDGRQRRTAMFYDALGRLGEVRDANDKPTKYFYDKGDRLTSVVDPRGLTTSYDRDGFGDLWKQVSPDSGVTTFLYDAAGLLKQQVRADNVHLDYSYDELGRLLAYGAQGQTRSFGYDACTNGKGRVCRASSGGTTDVVDTYFTYTQQGLLATRREVVSAWNGSAESAVNYGYDGMGRLSSVAYPSGTTAGYGYTDGQLSALTVRANGVDVPVVRDAQHQPLGAVEGWQYGNGLTRRYNRDLEGRVTGVSTGTPSSLVQSLRRTSLLMENR